MTAGIYEDLDGVAAIRGGDQAACPSRDAFSRSALPETRRSAIDISCWIAIVAPPQIAGYLTFSSLALGTELNQ
jgi:hypothetical protein